MNRFRKMLRVGLFKSLWINFYCLPFKQAIQLPILVSRDTRLHVSNRQCINMMGGGKLRIGFMDREWRHDEKSLFSVDGKLIIKGTGYHQFASGLSLCIVQGAVMEIGNNFSCTHNAKILVFKKVVIGDDNMWSFDEIIMDSDAHLIYDECGEMISYNKEIYFGNNVWLGCRSTVLKGATIPSGCIVAAGSTITSCVYPKNSIITSKGKVIKENIVWNKTLNYNG